MVIKMDNLKISNFEQINKADINLKRLMLLEESMQAVNQQYLKYYTVI